jgi:hypothetical protein
VARCVTCKDELHPERAKKYDYCTRPGCQAENVRGQTIVGVGVNKAAEQFVLLNERVKDEMARGKYHDPRRGLFGGYQGTHPSPTPGRQAPKRSARETPTAAESWTKEQQDRALAMHITGRKSQTEIARELKLDEQTVAKMLSAAYAAAHSSSTERR